MAGTLAIQALEQQEASQLSEMLDARTKLVEYGLKPVFPSPPNTPLPRQIQEIVRDLEHKMLLAQLGWDLPPQSPPRITILPDVST